jgi:hypothetical protein
VSSIFNILNISSEEYPLALALRLRLYNIGTDLALRYGLIVHSELAVLRGEHPGQREEVVLLGKVATHAHQVETEQIFASDYVNAGVVVDLLVEVHTDQDVGVD